MRKIFLGLAIVLLAFSSLSAKEMSDDEFMQKIMALKQKKEKAKKQIKELDKMLKILGKTKKEKTIKK